MLHRTLTRLPGVLLTALFASGCATITGDAMQAIDIVTVDAQDRPLRGMMCTLVNGSGEQTVITPAASVQVRRSATELEIECVRDGQVARGTVVARGENKMEHSFIPGGSLLAVIDHMSGYMYSYPSPLVLRAGEHLRFEFSSAARAELVAALTNSSAPSPKAPPTISITTVSTAPPTAVGAAGAATPAAIKPQPPPRTPANGKPRAGTATAAAVNPPAAAAPPTVGAQEALDARDRRLLGR